MNTTNPLITFGGLNTMWLLVMFDLPTETKEDRRCYHDFHGFLLDDGFAMLQYSVYARHCASDENAVVHKQRIHAILPPGGEVRILQFTDKQFGKMEVYNGKMHRKTESPPEQTSLF